MILCHYVILASIFYGIGGIMSKSQANMRKVSKEEKEEKIKKKKE